MRSVAHGVSTIILAVRNTINGEAATAAIQQQAGCKPDVIKPTQLDVSDFVSVQKFARKLSEEVSQLQVALLNAGGGLAISLLPKLRDAAVKTDKAPTLEFTASVAHLEVKAESIAVGPNESLIVIDKMSSPSFLDAKEALWSHQVARHVYRARACEPFSETETEI
ncbi:MAG: hypothetical protein M1837_005450 [Sclerophora amabilis]|nr:MAG: hypothetical protein M1837_005450 [Sclerophora amabilis]